MNATANLLEAVAKISAKYSTQQTAPLNLFRVLGVEADERRICRLLYDLLLPSGSHGMGNLMLKLFFRDVLSSVDIHDYELDSADVSREYVTHNGRKIDLVIRTKDRFLPIEVKIFAADLPNQCRDYYQEAKARRKYAKLVYLSRFGNMPAHESIADMNPEDILCVSFSRDIRLWLSDCISRPEILSNNRVREVLVQFMEAVENFTIPNRMEEEKMSEIADEILSSPEKLRAAVDVKNAVDVAIEQLRVKFFEEVRNAVNEPCTTDYNKAPSSRDKALRYSYGEGIDVVFGVDDGLYVSYLNTDGADHSDFAERAQASRSQQGFNGFSDNLWLYWEYCNVNGNVDFRTPNDAMFALCDENTRKDFVHICAEKIKQFLAYR